MESKEAIRQQMKRSRDAIPVAERRIADAAIAQAVIGSRAYRECSVLYAYRAFGSEIETESIIRDAWKSNKVVALPRCVPGTRNMEWYRIDSFEGLVRSRLGVEEPIVDESRKIEVIHGDSVALVPGLAFDEDGFRIGYGGGFYDIFLADFPGTAIGLCRRCQMVDQITCRDKFDIAVDYVITD